MHIVHMRRRGNYLNSRHVYPLPFRTGEEWETSAELEMHVHLVRRRERLSTETAEGRETRLSVFQLLKRLTVGQTVPEIPIRVGSKKLELLQTQSFCLCQISV